MLATGRFYSPFSGGHANPSFADAVFLNIQAVFVIKADADVVLKNSSHMMRAALVGRHAVGQRG